MDEILLCDHLNKSYWALLSCGTLYYALQGGSIFSVCGWNEILWCDRSVKSHWAYFCLVLIIVVYLMVLTFRSILLLSFPLHILHVLFFSHHFFYSRIITMGSRHPWRPLTPTALGPRMVILEMKTRRMMVLRDVYGRPEELNNGLLIPFLDWFVVGPTK